MSQLKKSNRIKITFRNQSKRTQLNLQNASVRPLVGESVLVRGAIVFGSPIKYEGKKLLVFTADGLEGLPSVIGSISIDYLLNIQENL